MRKFFFLFVLVTLVAPLAAAEVPVEAVTAPDAATDLAEQGCAEPADGDLEALFAELGDGTEQEGKIIRPDNVCETANDCYERYGEPTSCNGTWYCRPGGGGVSQCVCDPY